jgi:hypothetical protein
VKMSNFRVENVGRVVVGLSRGEVIEVSWESQMEMKKMVKFGAGAGICMVVRNKEHIVH